MRRVTHYCDKCGQQCGEAVEMAARYRDKVWSATVYFDYKPATNEIRGTWDGPPVIKEDEANLCGECFLSIFRADLDPLKSQA